MGLFENIQAKYLEARKSQDKFLSTILGMLVSDLKYEKINKQKELEDADVISVIQKNLKQKKEALEEFKKANRKDLIESTEKEIELLSSFLPAMLSDAEISDIVSTVVKELSATSSDTGKVMKEVMQRVKGRADGAKVKEIVSKILQG
ncbi:MAG: GatB/YqeY domain-containing protein [Brevinematales bacterium]|nr:GatB/YqeY domain-containing protein [Brevinematales bacterium]